jgi:hypothetical protein
LLDSLFAHPAGLFRVISHLDICDGHTGQSEFFRNLLGVDEHSQLIYEKDRGTIKRRG